MVPKDKNSVASPDKKKENNIPKEVVAQAKAAALPRGSRSKTVPEPLTRKTEASKGLRKPVMPTKASSSKLASNKAKTES